MSPLTIPSTGWTTSKTDGRANFRPRTGGTFRRVDFRCHPRTA